MSTLLWKYYLENDLDKFKQLLATANYSSVQPRPSYAGTLFSSAVDSPGRTLATSPLAKAKAKSKGGRASGAITLTRADINSKDAHGVTLLHLMASSSADGAADFGLALLEISMLDLYVQDLESGWTALHRALYSGNISLARAIMDRDIRDLHGSGGATHAGGLIKIKDHEGNSPFDVYATTIALRMIPHGPRQATLAGSDVTSDDDEVAVGDDGDHIDRRNIGLDFLDIRGDELFAFGSNKNLTLGFGDEDDRQFPERLFLKRPQYMQQRYHREHIAQVSRKPNLDEIEDSEVLTNRQVPAVVEFIPMKIQDIQLSKLHSAVLTADPESNLYLCGYGMGGRLGTGDESTRFHFTNISGGGLRKRKVTAIGLGQNHTIAVTSEGEVFTWGSNNFGQLGYTLANQSSSDDDPTQLYPRQLFGLLKREFVVGCAASRTHSVLFTSTSLYTFGKHDGQLGLVDSDARSLEMQTTPRKVAASLFSSAVCMVTAIDKATACLLENHDVWIFANYGYAKIVFPLDGLSNYLKGSFSNTHYDRPNYIAKICSGGDTICALAREGDVYTVNVTQKIDPAAGSSSTTNPAKIRGALSTPQRIWSLKKEHMAVQDVDVGQDGSVIICTNAGSVWRRVKRAKIKDANAVARSSEYKPKDYKFSRIPGLTRIAAVRSNAFGGFAAVRKDCDVLRNQLQVTPNTLWHDMLPLLAFHGLSVREDSDTENPAPRLWKPQSSAPSLAKVRQAILIAKDIEVDLHSLLSSIDQDASYDASMGSTVSDIRIPCHQFLLTARSTTLRRGLFQFQRSYYFEIPGVLLIEYDKEGRPLLMFPGVDVLTLINLTMYLYTDSIVSFWNITRQHPKFAFRYREVRIELMKLAGQLDMRALEHASRLMSEPGSTMHKNLDLAVLDHAFLETGDVEIELIDGTVKVHSALICQRCPFFEGMFHGRARGSWLSSRRRDLEGTQEAVKVDLKHVNKACFMLVLRHLYADAGEELFEDATAGDLDAFLDQVLDVLAVANELMIDRLALICQKIIGSYVNTRNACWLLNAIAPCSITEFKDAALEYICLNLEGMLENHLLDELDEELMAELDRVVRDNQLSYLPVSKSGRAEAELIEHHPGLLDIMEKSKRIKIDSMALRSRYHEDEVKMAKYANKSPLLRAKTSSADMMFSMDEDELRMPADGKVFGTPVHGKQRAESDLWMGPPSPSSNREDAWFDSKGKQLSPASASVQGRSLSGLGPSTSNALEGNSPTEQRSTIPKDSESSPWADLTTAKLSMKQIMAQASESRQSNISSAMSMSASPALQPVSSNKVSQKERKRLHQQEQQKQLQKALDDAQGTSEAISTPSKGSPWQIPVRGPKVSLRDDLRTESGDSDSGKRRLSPGPSLTMRQTIPGNAKKDLPSSPQQPLSKRSVSLSAVQGTNQPQVPTRPSPQPRRSQPSAPSSSSPVIPRSIRHNTSSAAAEPSLQISITDILAQQQIEKDIIKEASAKRSLQEIQEEQAFQEWWDQEEAATRARMEQEEAPATASSHRSGRGGRNSRGRGKIRAGGGRGRGKGKGNGAGESAAAAGGSGKGKAT